MILGIGSDLIDIRRIEKTIERHGDRFFKRIFTDVERARAERKQQRVATYAKRFAAKEACSKALGTGLRAGVFWRDMGVINQRSGRPTMRLTGGALERLNAMLPQGHEAQIDVTITDEYPLAQAFVIISAVPKKCKEEQGFFRGYVLGVIIPAVLFVVVFQTLLFKPFRIPSESMLPNLLVGDYILVSKFSYGYSRFSIPFAPRLFSGRIWGAEPKRGDVVVFRPAPNDGQDFVKRVVGLPGDRIQMIRGILHINGDPAKQEKIADFVVNEDGTEARAAQYRETLPGGVTHTVIDLDPNSELDNTPVFTVPPGHVFMMGDNRDDSADSRVPEAVGYVPMENLVGRADLIFFSVSGGSAAWEFWRWPWTVRFNRMFSRVR